MNEYRTSSLSTAGAAGVQQQQNRVLRNTYWLLALSLIPTVLGAAVGLYTGIGAMFAGRPIVSLVVFMAGAFGLMYLIERNKDSAAGVGLLLLFTFFMGLMLSRLVGFVLGFSNGTSLIMMAFGGTAVVFGAMASVAGTIKRDLSGMSKWLVTGAIVLLVAMVANIFLQMPALMLALSVLAIGIFSAFLLMDLQRIVRGGETNYVVATMGVYLSLYNIFSNLLVLLGVIGGDD